MSIQSREQAIHRIRARRHFVVYLVFYLALTAYLISLWARSGADHFWPMWALLGGGIGLATQASHVFGWQLPINEERIRREIDRNS